MGKPVADRRNIGEGEERYNRSNVRVNCYCVWLRCINGVIADIGTWSGASCRLGANAIPDRLACDSMASCCRNAQVLCDPEVLSHSLKDRKEEGLVLLNRAAERAPELVLLNWGLCTPLLSKKSLSIERGVPDVFKRVAMELVRSAFADYHHLAAHG